MCGIYGWQLVETNVLTPYQRSVMAMTLAEEMTQRGRDSYGAALWAPGSEDASPTIIKELGKAGEGAQDMLYDASQCNQFFAHTRAATVGGITRKNAHPFTSGSITGVHNGSVSNWDSLNKKYKRAFEVDSQHVFAHIDEDLDTKELDFGGTIVYVNEKAGYEHIFCARSQSGSFEIASVYLDEHNKDSLQGIVFASTVYAIRRACERAGLAFNMWIFPPEILYFIREGKLYKTEVKMPLSYNNTRIWTSDTSQDFRNGTDGSKTGRRVGSNYPSDLGRLALLEELTEDQYTSLRWVQPRADQIASTNNIPRVFFGQNMKESMCPTCKHYLPFHIQGFCTHERCTEVGICNNSLPLCTECGCYMVDTIHVPTGDGVRCTVCCTDCKDQERPRLSLSKNERKRLRKLEKQKNVKIQQIPADACALCSQRLFLDDSKKTHMCWSCRRKYHVDGRKLYTKLCGESTCTNALFTEVALYTGKCYGCRTKNDPNASADNVTEAEETQIITVTGH